MKRIALFLSILGLLLSACVLPNQAEIARQIANFFDKALK